MTQNYSFPQSPEIPIAGNTVIGVFDPRLVSSVSTTTANLAFGNRVLIPRAGVITSIAIFIGTSSGNIDLGIYSIAGTNRNKLFSTGSTAATPTNNWQTAACSVAVNSGDVIDLCFSVDNTSVTFGRIVSGVGALSTIPSGWDTDAPGSDTLTWVKGSSFPLPAQFTSVVQGASTTLSPVILAKLG